MRDGVVPLYLPVVENRIPPSFVRCKSSEIIFHQRPDKVIDTDVRRDTSWYYRKTLQILHV